MTSRTPAGFIATESQARHETVDILRQSGNHSEVLSDEISIEEPLEIRIGGPDFEETTLAITMRTPGHDHELSLGFLFGEGIISSIDDVTALEHCRPPSPGRGLHNSICITLAGHVRFDPEQLSRHVYTTSSCGVCGKTSIESVLEKPLQSLEHRFAITTERLTRLPHQLRHLQADFSRTGGIHAAGLISADSEIAMIREDIGRHNAVDKLIGAALLTGNIPLSGQGLMLSGRAGFELVQKAVMAGAEFLAAIGPPSSLSVELAEDSGMTLAGFVNEHGYNLYSHPKRVT